MVGMEDKMEKQVKKIKSQVGVFQSSLLSEVRGCPRYFTSRELP